MQHESDLASSRESGCGSRRTIDPNFLLYILDLLSQQVRQDIGADFARFLKGLRITSSGYPDW